MVVILGATGYIGQAFVAELRRRGTFFVPITRSVLDYTRFDLLFKYVRSEKPELIINAAGFTGRPTTSACETARAETIRANTLLPQTVARVCYLTNTAMGHVSSGSVFTGAKIADKGSVRIETDLTSAAVQRLFKEEPHRFRGFDETDLPNFSFRAPSGDFYNGSKALAEESLRWFERIYVWRPGPVFDEFDHPRNLLSQLRPGASNRQFGSLSHRGEFVRACLDLWERRAAFGTYHVVNPGISSGGQIIDICERFQHSRLRMDSHERTTLPTNETPAAHCILDSAKLRAAGIQLRPVSEALGDAIEHWQTAQTVFTTHAS